MFFRHSSDKLIYPLLALVLLFVISYRPHYRLRKQMPPDFNSEQDAGPKGSLEQRVAWAYWESALMDVQWQYPHGHPLPMDPPSQFRVDAQVLGPTASDPATRKRYWQRLQQIWNTPAAWEKVYEWDWNWINDPIESASQWLRDAGHKMLNF